MEVMEDGNLMDKVHILIQRDMEYYKNKQTVLQEIICPGVIGGKLDFPRSASFAAMKLVLWWEEEYVAAYRKPSGFLQKTAHVSSQENVEASGGCGGIVKASDPAKFVNLISKSADQLLGHLHILTQEALDHADLTVLTGTIGACALLKNCLWYYVQQISAEDNKSLSGNYTEQLQTGYKKYHEMCEALAERLLDLHCRLLSLYILQDAECLDWENEKPFCEFERGSYVIQMWWLYMLGTKEDLWNTVPPKMAQRVFAGMLNDSLTILAVRYTQSVPSFARHQLMIVDLSNLLLCIGQLLPAICENADELVGVSLNNKSKILRDIHVKCQELLMCFLLRGATLDILQKIFKNGVEETKLLKQKGSGPQSWIIFAYPNLFHTLPKDISKIENIDENSLIALEIMVLLAQPQPNWSQLLKVLCMKNCKILKLIMQLSYKNLVTEMKKEDQPASSCNTFLCPSDGSCKNVDTSYKIMNQRHYYDLVQSCTEVILSLANEDDLTEILLPIIMTKPNWYECFERTHVWNQIRPPWYEAIINFVSPLLPIISETVINAIKTGASMYQAMSLILACYSQIWHCAHPVVQKISHLIQDLLPANIIPLNRSVLLQILISALYMDLLKRAEAVRSKEVKFNDQEIDEVSDKSVEMANVKQHRSSLNSCYTFTSDEEIALAVAESLCSIDEDNKHTDQIEDLLDEINNFSKISEFRNEGTHRVEHVSAVVDVLVSDLLLSQSGKKSLKTIFHFLKSNHEWIYQQLNVSENKEIFEPNKVQPVKESLLHSMFYVGYRPFDQLLTGEWLPNWLYIMQIPMGLSVDRVWLQISLRWEFRDINSSKHTPHDTQIINHIISLLRQ